MAIAEKTPGFTPEIVLLYCRQSLADQEKPFEGFKPAKDFTAKLAPLPCSSKVEVGHMLKIMESGADGILVVGCPAGACQFLVGNARAEKRVEYARSLLEQAGLEPERLTLMRGSQLTLDDILTLGAKLVGSLREMGPNPMKPARCE